MVEYFEISVVENQAVTRFFLGAKRDKHEGHQFGVKIFLKQKKTPVMKDVWDITPSCWG